MAAAASSISARASALRSGSMSEEFSGQSQVRLGHPAGVHVVGELQGAP